jgi:hypothetical protein
MVFIATHQDAYLAATKVHPGAAKFHVHDLDSRLVGFTFALRGGRTYAWITSAGQIGTTACDSRSAALLDLLAAVIQPEHRRATQASYALHS